MARNRVGRSGVWLMVGLISGCAGSGAARTSSVSRYTMLRQTGISQSSAFVAAEQALLGEHLRIDVRDPEGGLLRTVPVSSVGPSSAGPLSGALGARRPIRRFVEVRVLSEGQTVSIGCKALVQENQAVAHRTFERERGLSDIPSDTPADREAGSTLAQQAVWKTTGRDQALERNICRSIERILQQDSGANSPDS